MTSGLPVQQNCGSRSSGLDPESPPHDGVQRWRRTSLNPTQLQTWEPRGRERFEREGGGAGGEESSSCNCVLLLLGASSLYRGRWDEINPSPKPREEGAAAKGDGAGFGLRLNPQNPNPRCPMRMRLKGPSRGQPAANLHWALLQGGPN